MLFYILLGDCIDAYPFFSEDKQCLQGCKWTEDQNLVNNKCYSNCHEFEHTLLSTIIIFIKDYEYAFITCRCDYNWIFDDI